MLSMTDIFLRRIITEQVLRFYEQPTTAKRRVKMLGNITLPYKMAGQLSHMQAQGVFQVRARST